jgi:aspartyl-tRNA(Asn)/glutamyl-tRNA(Gln) amidotransferase subunit C
MSVTAEDVRRIATLSRLAVPAEREPALVAQLNGILQHMDVLRQLPDEAGHGDEHAPGMRLADDSGPAVALVRGPAQIAPAFRDGFFLVPRLATHDAAGASVDDEGGA